MSPIPMRLKFRAFESCVHCRDVYYFYLDAILNPQLTAAAAMVCRCKEEAFLILAVVHCFSAEPMSDEEYDRIGMLIASSTLPEKMPDDAALAALQRAHMNNPRVRQDIKLSMDLMHNPRQRKTNPKDLN